MLCRVVERPLSGTVADVLHWTGTGALIWWAIAELLQGVNPFRRLLGAVVLVGLVVSRLT